MSRLIITQQEKGGIWKTFLSVHVLTWLRSQGHNFRPLDFDYQPGVISRIFPESASFSPDARLLPTGESLMPQFIERVIGGELFVVDSGANTGASWEALFALCPQYRDQMRAAGVKVTLLVPVSLNANSRQKFNDYQIEFPHATRIMVVIRQYPTQQFELPPYPPELTIELPHAPLHLYTTYEQTLTPMDVIATSDDPRFRGAKGMAGGYLPRLHAQFEKVRQHLIP
jgi:hypothetical protein